MNLWSMLIKLLFPRINVFFNTPLAMHITCSQGKGQINSNMHDDGNSNTAYYRPRLMTTHPPLPPHPTISSSPSYNYL